MWQCIGYIDLVAFRDGKRFSIRGSDGIMRYSVGGRLKITLSAISPIKTAAQALGSVAL